MKIYIDADGCPVVNLTVDIAKEYDIPVIIVKNYAHEITNPYATIVTVDIAPDSADYYIINNIENGDLVITQDYGVAAITISKEAICITQNGLIIASHNIDGLLNSRHMNQQLRKNKRSYSKIKKRTSQDNINFEHQLRSLIK
ncbi:MAG TPA: YaiI/YqxD family protein [Epulopiscium sp.]|nr:YaiI/YqxD family protein [Candidatus Epulonipiscium sp.]